MEKIACFADFSVSSSIYAILFCISAAHYYCSALKTEFCPTPLPQGGICLSVAKQMNFR